MLHVHRKSFGRTAALPMVSQHTLISKRAVRQIRARRAPKMNTVYFTNAPADRFGRATHLNRTSRVLKSIGVRCAFDVGLRLDRLGAQHA